mmetsp:Transcript_14559/g.49292  ORF Transcript_14559/g.49292 Transcript_14559/m.49292 type:complete len:319 (-) Transcript_14559:196-1152(-)
MALCAARGLSRGGRGGLLRPAERLPVRPGGLQVCAVGGHDPGPALRRVDRRPGRVLPPPVPARPRGARPLCILGALRGGDEPRAQLLHARAADEPRVEVHGHPRVPGQDGPLGHGLLHHLRHLLHARGHAGPPPLPVCHHHHLRHRDLPGRRLRAHGAHPGLHGVGQPGHRLGHRGGLHAAHRPPVPPLGAAHTVCEDAGGAGYHRHLHLLRGGHDPPGLVAPIRRVHQDEPGLRRHHLHLHRAFVCVRTRPLRPPPPRVWALAARHAAQVDAARVHHDQRGRQDPAERGGEVLTARAPRRTLRARRTAARDEAMFVS